MWGRTGRSGPGEGFQRFCRNKRKGRVIKRTVNSLREGQERWRKSLGSAEWVGGLDRGVKEKTASRCSSRAGGHAFSRGLPRPRGVQFVCLAKADGVIMRTEVAYDGVEGEGEAEGGCVLEW